MTVTTDAGTLDDLYEAIRIRAELLKETTSDATVAAAITILRSLKAATPKANTKSVSAHAYRIVATDLFGGLYREKGVRKTKVCARVGSHFGHRSNIRPAIGFAPGSNAVFRSRVFAIYTSNPHDKFKKNVNAPAQCWYVLCEHVGQAVAYAENHIVSMLRKEAGMAKYTLSIAQAQASTRSPIVQKEQAVKNGSMSPRAAGIAYGASELVIDDSGFSSGEVSVTFFDALNYSKAAAGGDTALANAIGNATRSMVGYVERSTGLYLSNFHKKGIALGARMSIPWRWN